MAKHNQDKILPLGQQFAPVKTAAEVRKSFFKRHRRGMIVTLIVVVALLLVGGGVAALYVQNHSKQTGAPTATDPSKAVNSEGDQLAVSKKAQAVIEQAAATASGGDATSAASTLTQAAESSTDANDKIAYYSQAISIQIEAGSYDAAQTSAQAAIQADPNNYLLYANLGYVYEAAGNNAEAISSFQKAIEVFDANPDSEATDANGGKAGIQAEIERLQQA